MTENLKSFKESCEAIMMNLFQKAVLFLEGINYPADEIVNKANEIASDAIEYDHITEGISELVKTLTVEELGEFGRSTHEWNREFYKMTSDWYEAHKSEAH